MNITSGKLSDKKTVNRYIILFMLTYLVSYLTRINFGAIIEKIIETENMDMTLLSLAISGSAITYGGGQLVSGYMGDRIQPKWLIGGGLVLTSITNTLIPLFPNTYFMIGIWCVNGFIQAFMWPPMVRLMGSLFSSDDYSRACVVVSWGSSLGTIIIYLVSPLIITLSGWKAVFLFSTACGIIMASVWSKSCPLIPSGKLTQNPSSAESAPSKKGLFSPLLIFVLLAIALQGALRDGVTTWIPSYISDIFDINTEFAILSSVILPLFSILCFYVASQIYRKKIKNPLTCAGLFFAVGFAASAVLAFFHDKSLILSVFLAAVLCGCMHGVNLMMVCMVPAHYKKFGKVSFVSGLMNSFTYVGSSISTFGIAALHQASDSWRLVIAIWAVAALAGGAITLANSKIYQRKIMND